MEDQPTVSICEATHLVGWFSEASWPRSTCASLSDMSTSLRTVFQSTPENTGKSSQSTPVPKLLHWLLWPI